MAPKYKLTYFNARGRAEAIRFLFHYGGIAFEDVRIERADWPNVAQTFPNGKLPVLEIKGHVINQSVAICRFVAKKVGLAGDNDFEALLIDAAADTIVDAINPVVRFKWSIPHADISEKRKWLLEEHFPNYFGSLEKQVEDNEGYLVNGKLSYADILLVSKRETLECYMGIDVFAEYPILERLVQKVYSIPEIGAWITKRPKTEF